ncbi:MAG TPA: hypothetical protein ENH49_05485 [Candidatus Marinimicrobia bacterium]|nr:hypothetical protein [Candidatus Neomarinimicrobiota bacterium]
MADYSRTRVNLKTVMASVKALLSAYGSWNVDEHEAEDVSKIFSFLASIQCPACILIYGGSTPEPVPNRTLHFQIVIATRDMGDHPAAVLAAQDLIDKAFELLDYQIVDTTVLLRLSDDDPFIQGNSGINLYKIDVTAEDS